MSKLLPILDGVEFEPINDMEWYIIVGDVVCGQMYAEYFDDKGYAVDHYDIKGMSAEDLTWTITNYKNEYKYINPTAEELRKAVLTAI